MDYCASHTAWHSLDASSFLGGDQPTREWKISAECRKVRIDRKHHHKFRFLIVLFGSKKEWIRTRSAYQQQKKTLFIDVNWLLFKELVKVAY